MLGYTGTTIVPGFGATDKPEQVQYVTLGIADQAQLSFLPLQCAIDDGRKKHLIWWRNKRKGHWRHHHAVADEASMAASCRFDRVADIHVARKVPVPLLARDGDMDLFRN